MKNKFFKILVLMLCVCLSLFVACKKNKGESNSENSNQSIKESIIESPSEQESEEYSISTPESELESESEIESESETESEIESESAHACEYNQLRHNETHHWYECTCGEKDSSTEEPHAGGTATCEKKASCEICGEEYGKLLSHSYDKICSDDELHWYECSCGAKNTEQAHQYTNLKSNATYHWYECSCGAKDTKQAHQYTNLKSDATYHWYECNCGAKNTEQAHQYINLKSNSTHHWYECSCGAKNTQVAHSGGEATCTQKAKCEVCSQAYGLILEHDIHTKVISPTCQTAGYTLSYCGKCSYVLKDSYVSMKTHSGSSKCSSCNVSYFKMLRNFLVGNGSYSTDSSGGRYGMTIWPTSSVKYMVLYYLNSDKIIWWSQTYSGSSLDTSFQLEMFDSSGSYHWEMWMLLSSYTLTMEGTLSASSLYSSAVSLPYDTCYVAPSVGSIPSSIISSLREASATALHSVMQYFNVVLSLCPENITVKNFGFNNYSTTSSHTHTWQQSGSIIEPTCTNDGKITYKCSYSDCYITKIASLPAYGHVYGEATKIQEESCSQVGVISEKCILCSYVKTTQIDKLKHNYTDVVTPPTCSEIGYTTHTCPNCDNVLIDAYVDAVGHKMDEHFTLKKQTCSETGIERYCCVNGSCDYFVDEIIPMDDHNYEEIAVSTSYITEECIGCGKIIATPVSYTIDYDLDGGSATNKTTYTIETDTFTLVNPTKTGYKFIGWSSFDFVGLVDVVTIEKGSIGNKKYVANWEIDWGQFFVFSNNTIVGLTQFGKENCSHLNIPSIINGSKVTAIGASVFQNCSSLISVEIPDSVESIGSYAFSGCSSLTSVVIPDSVESIGSYAFSNCSNLTYNEKGGLKYLGNVNNPYLYLADTTSTAITLATIDNKCKIIGSYAFSGCSSLTSVVIPDSVMRIGSYAFSGCSSLTSVVIPDSVMRIGSYAFSGCSSLVEITLPFVGASKGDTENDYFGYIFGASSYSANYSCVPTSLKKVSITSTTSIDDYSFYHCSSLTSVVIPDSVTSIGYSAFRACSSLAEITLPFVGASKSGTSNTHFGYIFGASSCDDNDDYVPSSLKKVTITSATSIGELVFAYCDSLTSVVIGDIVTSIGSHAFLRCYSLTSVVIGDSVTSIGSDAFIYCSSLTSVYITDIEAWCGILFYDGWSNPLYYAKNLYLNNQLVTDLVIPDSVTSIGSYAFLCCSSLTSVEIPDSVTSIGKSAFDSCSSLTSVVIPDSVTSIGYSAFRACSSLAEITLPFVGASKSGTSNTHFGYIFGASSCDDNDDYVPSSLKKVTITSATSIGELVFAYCDSLTSVVIGNSVTSIDYAAFVDCDSLTSVVLGDSVTSIGEKAFHYCSSLKTIEIPDSITSIGNEVFEGCSSLIYNVKGVLKYLGNANNPYLYLADTTYTSITSAIIDSKCKIIGKFAFENCSYLISVEIPNSVESIDSYAFSSCSSLTSVVIPNSVESIGSYAFSGCRSLTSVVIPDTVTSIGQDVFYSCSSLIYNVKDGLKYLGNTNNPYLYLADTTSTSITSAVIDSKCKFIGSSTFHSCSSLTSVVIPDSVTSIGSYAFFTCSSLTSIVIPDSVTSIGNSAFCDCTSLTSVVIGDNVTSIGSSAFTRCESLTSVVIPDSVTSIDSYAFSSCTSLTSVVIGDSVECIGDNAFRSCSSLTSVVIGNSVTSLGSAAFYKCSSLTSIVIPDSVESIGEMAFHYCDSLKRGFYKGSASEWGGISIDSYNSTLTNATCYYSETEPTTSGNYWHYDESGNPVDW